MVNGAQGGTRGLFILPAVLLLRTKALPKVSSFLV